MMGLTGMDGGSPVLPPQPVDESQLHFTQVNSPAVSPLLITSLICD
jgi:hypothetical protein